MKLYISLTCEVVVKWGPPTKVCALPAVAGYPAAGGGWMCLCAGHVKPHEKYVHAIEDIESGIADRMVANGSRG